MLKIALTSILLIAAQAQAEMTLKHGIYLSQSLGDIKADLSGNHKDTATYYGKDLGGFGTLYADLPTANASIYDGKISNTRSFGYNLRYAPEVGFGYELGLYFTKMKMPAQDVTLIHDNNSPFQKNTKNGKVDATIESPSSYMKTTDLYLGGLYNFPTIGDFITVENIMPYVGLGYAKVKGNWYKSSWRGYPNPNVSDEVAGYGQSGKTKISGHYTSAKVGVNFNENYNLELEYSKHKFHADSFRSLEINGVDAEFDRTSLNLIYSF